MKKLISKASIWIALPLLLVLGACDSFNLLPMHERLSGIWRFEEVTFRENWAIGRSDQTAIYRPFEIEFLPNRLVVLYYFDNFGNYTAVQGIWDFDQVGTGCYSGNCGEDDIISFYFDVPIPPFFVHEWEIRRLRYNRIRARERRTGGVFNFDLRRVD